MNLLGRTAVLVGIVGLVLSSASVVLAVDAVPTVDVSGVVLGEDAQPAVVTSARVEEFETPDSDPVVTPIDVAQDGTFTVALRVWGTPEQPARAVITAFGPPFEPEVDENGCTFTTTPFGTVELEIPGDVPSEPIEVVLDQLAEQGLCPPVTATPVPEAPGPSITLPPTDTGVPGATGPATGKTAIDVLLVVGILVVGFGSLLRHRGVTR